MIAVDSSALVAIAQREDDHRLYLQALQVTDSAFLAPTNYLETGVLLVQRRIVGDQTELATWLKDHGVEVADHLDLHPVALDAYLRFGKGFHAARLNLADCFAYALAKTLDAPLLYKGDDFARTDVRSAL